ncbi:MAG: carbamoyltransferase [Cyclobacteriaceae bacterium]
MSYNVIGISAFYHDSACCIIQDGKLIAAVQEERFSRKKNDPDLPKKAFLYCLEVAGISIDDVDCIGYYENPTKKISRQLWSGNHQLSIQSAMEIDPNYPVQSIRSQLGYDGPVKIFDHHQSHAASSFYFSGFDEAAIMTVDGVGEWATTTYGKGDGTKLEILEEVNFPDSIGMLYSTLTSFMGFKVNSGEYKVMGLAPYGEPKFVEQVREMITLKENGQYELNMKYFDFLKGERMYSDEIVPLFGLEPREKETEILQVHKDIAKSLQVVLEEVLINKATYVQKLTGSKNLCMAGGVALNCVANGKILKESPFDKLFVQPASNDAGCALGAAVLAYLEIGGTMKSNKLPHVYLGPEYSSAEIENLLGATSLKYKNFQGKRDERMAEIVNRLSNGKVIGWFSGRMEFGPRSLGARSILADPRRPEMRDLINAMVKKREGFRPFAPAVLNDYKDDHFLIDHESPFMLETCQVKSELDLPAITHVDGSARVQTVTRETNPEFAALLEAFNSATGCPILLNTSFNVRDEPIVCSPEDAIRCFITTNIDCLVLGDFLLDKEENDLIMLNMINTNLVSNKGDFEINPSVYTFI